MTVSELIEYLKTFPQDAEVYYRDPTYGDPDVEVEQTDLEMKDDVLLIH